METQAEDPGASDPKLYALPLTVGGHVAQGGPWPPGLRDEWVLVIPLSAPVPHTSLHLVPSTATSTPHKQLTFVSKMKGRAACWQDRVEVGSPELGGQPSPLRPLKEVPPPQLLILLSRCHPPTPPPLKNHLFLVLHWGIVMATGQLGRLSKPACFSDGSVGTSRFAEQLHKPAPSALSGEYTPSLPTPLQ